ncbi:eukaryotic translation initiation factor 3 subunit D-like [Xenia sp. Carnegie-2017]|uniref:eukaryotic translation initiation factor 3 subunit D-like n=1 Tax=Xenia sp. Carnegie-2017 TaxID=2897299 RepID=UPI001F043ADB|nr:eukaryotic translation initiation factor 3 subunit D-like [Xenia sp. Carnegie-2017]
MDVIHISRIHFVPPVIEDNPNGWGPTSISDAFNGIPYQPFSKGDKLGRVSDWSSTAYQDRRYQNKYLNQFGGVCLHAINQRNNRHDKERQMQRQQAGMQNLLKTRDNRLHRKLQKQFANRNNWQERRNQVCNKHTWGRGGGLLRGYMCICDGSGRWKVIEEMDFPRLSKLSLPNVLDPDDLVKCGELEYYDKAYDRVNIKNEVPLALQNRIFHKVTTTDDPVIRNILMEGNVFATDTIISTLMTCTRSVYSWDIIAHRVGSKLFFDMRDESAFDLLTVNETAVETPIDDNAEKSINSTTNLGLEATFINQNFSQQVLKRSEEKEKFDKPNPFIAEDNEEEEKVASVGYRYRKWNLGNDIEIVIRCEHDAVLSPGTYINIKALNEWESKGGMGEWRQKLDTQRGAVLATELKNNGCKLAKWTVASVLSGSEYLKIGYVSRKNFMDSSKHCILGTQQFKPRELASQMNLSMDNGWGIVRCIIDYCMNLEKGKYLILKDPNKGMIRIYDIPNNTFDSEDDDDDDEEEADDEDEDEQEEEIEANI